ncbi:MAG TPA: DUF6308 family protein [Chloroflexota bacterium]|nr:DUF6308 family protein [Chloroflexota bacterium]
MGLANQQIRSLNAKYGESIPTPLATLPSFEDDFAEQENSKSKPEPEYEKREETGDWLENGDYASAASNRSGMFTTVRLPSRTRHNRLIIDKCEWRIKTFVESDAYIPYDYQVGYLSPVANQITDAQVYAMNSVMRARSSRHAWDNFIGKDLPELETIPVDLDLIDSPDTDVEHGLAALAKLVSRIASVQWLTDMAASKVLYLLRPRFIAISDSYVRACLGTPDAVDTTLSRGDAYARRLLAVERGLRRLGQDNYEALMELYQYANALQVPNHTVSIDGKSVRRDIKVTLSKLRILDILLWTEVAIHGPTPHSRWSADYESAGPC